MNLLRTLLILVLLYYGFKVITRYLLPFLAKRWVNKAQEQFRQQQGNTTDADEAKRHEGEVKVESKVSEKENTTDKGQLGDYIDYEEIKDDN